MKTNDELAVLRFRLSELNAAVDAAISARTKWMDEHMEDFAVAKPSEVLYKRDGDNFVRLGIVSKLYRYHAGQNKLYDTCMEISYEYEMRAGSRCYDNTSSQGYMWLVNEADREQYERGRREQSVLRGCTSL